MRKSLPLLTLLLASAGCGQNGQPQPRSRDSMPPPQADRMPGAPSMVAEDAMPASNMQAARAGAGPNVAPTAAPGVAFNYRYAFRLAGPRVAELEEQHAQMCERLTLARCRITGLYYRVVGPDDIEGRLELKLDPGVARLFGRNAVEAVTRADGMLTESEISGEDVGTGIRQTGRSIDQLTADLTRIEARLAQRGVPGDERAQLDDQARQLREQIRALRDSRDAQQETLATTPMVFQYGSGALIPGFDQPTTLSQSLARGWENFLLGGKILLIILVTILPWTLAALLLWLGFRFARRRWFPKKAAEAEA